MKRGLVSPSASSGSRPVTSPMIATAAHATPTISASRAAALCSTVESRSDRMTLGLGAVAMRRVRGLRPAGAASSGGSGCCPGTRTTQSDRCARVRGRSSVLGGMAAPLPTRTRGRRLDAVATPTATVTVPIRRCAVPQTRKRSQSGSRSPHAFPIRRRGVRLRVPAPQEPGGWYTLVMSSPPVSSHTTMCTLTVELPESVVKLLGPTTEEATRHLAELAYIELFRQGQVSSGWAAEKLGISKDDFRELLYTHDVRHD